ncbi:MAG: D-alanyl-D-alanine carboxypeptidase family protein, partial [Oscillospiraceae bacterium]|nr:D-alanyl-D-alanine carboxypeptidase family protein [Oscillospiraceae bacterium]
MRYSRPVRIVFGILFFAIIFWYEGMWYQNSVMGSEFEAAAKLNAELREQRRLEDEAEDEAESGIVVESATETQATPEPTLRPEEDKAAVLGLPSPPEIDRNEFQYVLVNGDHPLDPITYEPQNLVYLNMTGDDTDIRTEYDGNRQVVDALIAQPLIDMVQACKAAGLPVYLSSGYRSYEIQRQNFERVCANNGIS